MGESRENNPDQLTEDQLSKEIDDFFRYMHLFRSEKTIEYKNDDGKTIKVKLNTGSPDYDEIGIHNENIKVCIRRTIDDKFGILEMETKYKTEEYHKGKEEKNPNISELHKAIKHLKEKIKESNNPGYKTRRMLTDVLGNY